MPPKFAPSIQILNAAISSSSSSSIGSPLVDEEEEEEELSWNYNVNYSNIQQQQQHEKREWQENDTGMFILYDDSSLSKSEREIKAYMDQIMGKK